MPTTFKWRAATNPSPPLFPFPHKIEIFNSRCDSGAREPPSHRRIASQTCCPADSISCNPGMPKRAVVCRSTSRISAAVSAFMIDLLLVTKLQHPPAADVHHLSGDVFSFFGSKERHGRGHVFHRGRAADGKPRVPHAARLA